MPTPKPFPLFTDGSSIYFTTDGVNFNALVGSGGSIPLSDLATQAADTFVANGTGGTASPTAVSPATAVTMLAISTPMPAQGAALTDATATINPGTDLASQYTLPASVPLTANRVLTLGTGGSPATNSIVSVWKLGAGAFTYTVKDDAATTLVTFASGSTKQLANFYYNGTHFVFLSLVYTA